MRSVAVAFFLLLCFAASAQLKKYTISNSGASMYSYCQPDFDFDYSEDSSKVYTGECIKEEITYGIICIKLLKPVADLERAEEVMIDYLDFLKLDFGIKSAAGYGKGHILNKNEKTKGIIDYWTDKEDNKWKVKAWTDGNFIAVMYAYSKKDLPEAKVNVYLDGFRLPG